MEAETLFGLGATAASLAVGVLILLTILLPLSVYSAQKWAHRCFKELQRMNKTLDRIEKKL